MAVFTQGLTAEEVAACRTHAADVRVLEEGAASWVQHWQARAGDLDVTDDSDDVLIVGGDAGGALASVMFALYRKQVPVLSLGLKAETLGVASEMFVEAERGSGAAAAIADFLTPAATPGRIFTIEGGDGAGKQTQAAMLVARLHKEGYPVRTIDFPHDAAGYGKIIRKILSGKHGSIGEVSPLLFATVYSMNRDDVRPLLKWWLRRGKNVVLDRYMESSFGHQAAKLENEEEKEKMIARLTAYEVRWLGIPASHRVRYLDLAPEVALAALQTDDTRKGLDIHETAQSSYKTSVRRCFRWCCDHFDHWQEMPQQEGETRKTRDQVHSELWGSLEDQFVNGEKDAATA